MASLNHVDMWQRNSWVPVTAEEAAQLCPGTVSAQSGLFMCRLCGQYVLFTAEGENERHFRHSSKEATKNCPERTFGPLYTPTFKANDHDLPLKLVLEPEGFRFELGFLFVPPDILAAHDSKRIIVKTDSADRFTYNFSRLNRDTITYLPVGSTPSGEYEIITSPELSVFWPKVAKGVKQDGSVFDGTSGKMLPEDSDVQINKKYYLISKWPQYCNCSSVRLSQIRKITVERSCWYLYEVRATIINHDAAKFFMQFHCRLTDSPIEMRLIWPIHIEEPYIVKHARNQMILHIVGRRDVKTKAFPNASVFVRKCSDGQIIQIECNDRQQLISSGQSNVLQYTYFWRENLNRTTAIPEVNVLDGKGTHLNLGQHYSLPADKLLRILPTFDGTVILLRDGKLFERRKLTANTYCTIENVQYGMEIQVLQGLDIVWQSIFIQRRDTQDDKDDVLLKKLLSFRGDEIVLPHKYGSLVGQLASYPKTRRWLHQAIMRGKISETALKYLGKYLSYTKR